LPVAAPKNWATPFFPPSRRVLPSGLKAQGSPKIGSPISLLVATSHSQILPVPRLVVRILWPSGVKPTVSTSQACTRGFPRTLAVAVSHNRTILSSDTVMRILPSGLKATVLVFPGEYTVQLPSGIKTTVFIVEEWGKGLPIGWSVAASQI